MPSRRTPFASLLGLAALACFAAAAAQAESASPWSLRMGAAQADFTADATLSLAAHPLPDADLRVPSRRLPLGELAWAASDRWHARLALSAPPTINVHAGARLLAMAPALRGELGTLRIAPLLLTATYGFDPVGALRPYAGGGIAALRILRSTDGDIAHLRADHAWGGVLQAGVELPLGGDWSAYLDVRKAFVKTKLAGQVPALGGPAVAGSVRLDPLLVGIGVGYRF